MLDFSLIKPYQFLIIAVHLLFLICLRWLLLTRNNSCVEDWRKFLQEKCVNSWLARYQLRERTAPLNSYFAFPWSCAGGCPTVTAFSPTPGAW